MEPYLYWYNPNIHPFIEYKSRRDCLKDYAKNENLNLTLDDEYGLRLFLKTVSSDTGSRCALCYRMRIEKTAMLAAKEGFKAFTTTLLISPYQDHETIKKICEETAEKYSVDFFYKDFRRYFREGMEKARAGEFYMQKYCGCIFSEEERFNQNKQTEKFQRLELLIGRENLKKLNKTSVLIFGAGGVGSWTAEALVRSGIGKIGIIDHDIICASNINRQMEATSETLGLPKASALKKRLLEINPQCDITSWDELFCLENAGKFKIEECCYVIDAIDSINHKLDLIEKTCGAGVTLFSSMGMALKTDPSKIKTGAIWKTDVCPLARHVRQGLRKRGFSKDFTVVYSTETPVNKKPNTANGSMVTVTGTAGLLLASLVINDILKHGE